MERFNNKEELENYLNKLSQESDPEKKAAIFLFSESLTNTTGLNFDTAGEYVELDGDSKYFLIAPRHPSSLGVLKLVFQGNGDVLIMGEAASPMGLYKEDGTLVWDDRWVHGDYSKE